MQRTFVAITLALALTCAFATTLTTVNYVKNPVVVVQNNETNYTNQTNGTGLFLASVNVGEVDLIAAARNPNTGNTSANSWTAVYRKLDSKVLTSTANTTLNFTQPLSVSYSNGYVYSIVSENDAGTNNIPQLVVYQTAVGGAALARVTLSSNTVNTYTPSLITSGQIGKNVYVFYLANNGNVTNPSQVNVTSFTIGTATRGSLEFNLTTSYTKGLTVTWGEALGSNQLYANWVEGAANTTYVLRYTTIDVTKGTYNGTATAAAYVNSSSCGAFSTDKKWYGDICFDVNGTAGTIAYSIRFSNSTILPFNNNATLFLNQSTPAGIYPYGPYLAIVYKDTVATANTNTYSYEIWNLDTLSTFKAKTTFLTTDIPTTFFRVVSGGLYTLTYETNSSYAADNSTAVHYTNIQVGQVLSGSYITSVLGFIMTIVAGVLLF